MVLSLSLSMYASKYRNKITKYGLNTRQIGIDYKDEGVNVPHSLLR